MTQGQLEQLRAVATNPKVDAKAVKIKCTDGDVLEGFVEFLDEEYRDVIFELLSSNNQEKYKKGTTYAILWDDVEDVKILAH